MSRMNWVAASAAMFLAAPMAQAQPRALEVPATAAWQHASTGMILPARAAGLQRRGLTDHSAEEMDVVAQYSGDAETEATVYLYRTQLPDVGLWFDRSTAAIAASPKWGITRADVPTPQLFSRPGATQASGLIAAMNIKASAGSTAIAVAPLGEWLLKVRMTSPRLNAPALEERVRAFMAGLRWPAPPAAERPARAMQACVEPLKLKRAKVIQPNIADALISLAGAMAAAKKGPALAAPVWCRDAVALGPHGVYRANGVKNSYTIALGDSGLALSIAPSLRIETLGASGNSWSMTRLDRNSTAALLSFDRLPPPDQALAVATSGGTGISATVK